ncbi:MAG TPA: replication initiator [Acidimicrobiales bacterium]|nr:replication initiator [Acidimicrobiales bacterium]
MSFKRDFTEEEIAVLVEAAADPGFGRWREMIRSTGGCADPIHLHGRSEIIDPATGEVLLDYDTDKEPLHRLLVACRNRRASRCPSCAETYRADTYQLIRAGLVGGKDVPPSVIAHPRSFATFTAPSFGPVHHRVLNADGTVRLCQPAAGCRLRHQKGDPLVGQAIDPGSYDYVGAVLWNAMSGALWHRTTTIVVRELAAVAGMSERDLRRTCRLSYGKVAEFQARGLVHFHVVIRLDGAEGPDQEAPSVFTVEVLEDAVRHAAQQAVVWAPAGAGTGGRRTVVWGREIDVQAVTLAGVGAAEVTDQQVAGYLAKYATKAAETTGTLDRPVACWHCKGSGADSSGLRRCGRCGGRGSKYEIADLTLNQHAKAMIQTCWDLGADPALEELRLRPWAHMLGFRGHFSTKSRLYSTTLTKLRSARLEWRKARLLRFLGCPEEATLHHLEDDFDPDAETVLAVGHWQYLGRGHTAGQALYARTIAEDLAEERRLARFAPNDEWEEPA